MQARQIATAFALIAFAATLLAGLAVGNPAGATLGRSIALMLLCYAVGRGVGALIQLLLDHEIRRFEAANPAAQLFSDEALAGDVPAAIGTEPDDGSRVIGGINPAPAQSEESSQAAAPARSAA